MHRANASTRTDSPVRVACLPAEVKPQPALTSGMIETQSSDPVLGGAVGRLHYEQEHRVIVAVLLDAIVASQPAG
jgi:hypothetical protein